MCSSSGGSAYVAVGDPWRLGTAAVPGVVDRIVMRKGNKDE